MKIVNGKRRSLSVLSFALTLVLWTPGVRAADPVFDDFNGPTLGPKWFVYFGLPGIVNNQDLGATAFFGMHLVTWQADTFSDDQFSEEVLSSGWNDSMMVMVHVRQVPIPDSAPRYGFVYNNEASPPRWILKYDGVAGPLTRIIGENLTAPGPQPGDTLRVEVEGSNPVVLRGYHNGNLVLTASDAAPERILSGRPGITFRVILGRTVTYPSPTVSSWRGGSLPVSNGLPPSPPQGLRPR